MLISTRSEPMSKTPDARPSCWLRRRQARAGFGSLGLTYISFRIRIAIGISLAIRFGGKPPAVRASTTQTLLQVRHGTWRIVLMMKSEGSQRSEAVDVMEILIGILSIGSSMSDMICRPPAEGLLILRVMYQTTNYVTKSVSSTCLGEVLTGGE